MVTAGLSAFDLHDDGGLWEIICNIEDLLDLAHCTRLERYPRNIVFLKLAHQRQRFLMRRDTRGANHTIDGGTIGTCAWDEATAFNLRAPLFWRQVHGIELGINARIQHVFQTFQGVIQNRFGHLATTGELRPKTGVGGCSHNGWIHGGRGHASQDHRWIAR